MYKGENVITVGLDDSTKAVGDKLYDHISSPNESLETMTTGYTENISHSGTDGAASYELKLKGESLLD